MTTGQATRRGETTSSTEPWEASYRRRLVITDLAIIVLTVSGTQLAWFGLDLAPVKFTRDIVALNYTTISVILALSWFVVLQIYGTRENRVIGAGNLEYRLIFDSALRLFGVVAIIAYLFQIQFARGYIITAFPAGIALLTLGRLVWRKWLTRRRLEGRLSNRVVLVGSLQSVVHTAREFARSAAAGYLIVGACVTSDRESVTDEIRSEFPWMQVSSGAQVADIRATMTASGADTVVLTSSDNLPPQKIRELSWTLEPGHEHLVVAPSLTDIGGPRIHTRPVAGLPLIHVETPRFDAQQRFTKRFFDIVCSSLLILVSGPVLIVIAILVKTTSAGPVLFRQERVGLDGKTFKMLKFRSMVVDAEARLAAIAAQQTTEGNSIMFKMKSDPRVTRVGAVLRRFSLDELPQFFNVFLGEMSLIGPRPPLQREVDQYEAHVHRRFLMKPGITGLWQVSGRSNLSWDDTVRLDLYYVENWSMTGDIIILLKTARAVLARDGAY